MAIRTAVTIDWLSYTVTPKAVDKRMLHDFSYRVLVAQQLSGFPSAFEDVPARHGYAYGMAAVGRAGLEVLMGGESQKGTVHVSWAGSALKGNDVRERVKWALYSGGRCTRLDLAFDVADRLDFRAFYDAARAGMLDTAAKRASIIDSDTGTTVYVGSRSSEQFLRVYDKGAQIGAEQAWTRIELECKGKKANAIANYIVGGKLTDIPRIIRAFCDWPQSDHWQAIFAEMPKLSVPKEEKQTDRAKWYYDTLQPCILDDLRRNEQFAMKLIAAAWSVMTPDQRDEIILGTIQPSQNW